MFAMSYSSSSPGCSSGWRLLFRASVLRLGVVRNVVSGSASSGAGASGGPLRARRFGLRPVRRRSSRPEPRPGPRLVARRGRARAGDVARRQVAQHGVVDLEHAGDLVERRRPPRRRRRGGRRPPPCARSDRRGAAGPRRRGCATCRRSSRRGRARGRRCRPGGPPPARGPATAGFRKSSRPDVLPSHGLDVGPDCRRRSGRNGAMTGQEAAVTVASARCVA